MSDLRARVEAAKATPVRKGRRKVEWNPLTLGQLAEHDVLAFDQTNTKTGWVRLRTKAFGGAPVVVRRGVLKEPPIPDIAGHEGTLRRSANMCTRIEEIIEKERLVGGAKLIVVHEMPAVYGMRIESSLMAALGVRLACLRYGMGWRGIDAKHAKRVLTGDPDAQKSVVKQALLDLLPEESFMAVSEQRWNLDQYDALGLAITYLFDRAQELAA